MTSSLRGHGATSVEESAKEDEDEEDGSSTIYKVKFDYDSLENWHVKEGAKLTSLDPSNHPFFVLVCEPILQDILLVYLRKVTLMRFLENQKLIGVI